MQSAVARKPREGLRVLCLDGGGTKGLLLIQMLEEMEKVMGRPIVQCFDFIAGSATGGVLALALAKGLLDLHLYYCVIHIDIHM